jgi:hypothetical protein
MQVGNWGIACQHVPEHGSAEVYEKTGEEHVVSGFFTEILPVEKVYKIEDGRDEIKAEGNEQRV